MTAVHIVTFIVGAIIGNRAMAAYLSHRRRSHDKQHDAWRGGDSTGRSRIPDDACWCWGDSAGPHTHPEDTP